MDEWRSSASSRMGHSRACELSRWFRNCARRDMLRKRGPKSRRDSPTVGGTGVDRRRTRLRGATAQRARSGCAWGVPPRRLERPSAWRELRRAAHREPRAVPLAPGTRRLGLRRVNPRCCTPIMTRAVGRVKHEDRTCDSPGETLSINARVAMFDSHDGEDRGLTLAAIRAASAPLRRTVTSAYSSSHR